MEKKCRILPIMEKCHNALTKQNQSENREANEKLEYENKIVKHYSIMSNQKLHKNICRVKTW